MRRGSRRRRGWKEGEEARQGEERGRGSKEEVKEGKEQEVDEQEEKQEERYTRGGSGEVEKEKIKGRKGNKKGKTREWGIVMEKAADNEKRGSGRMA